MSKKNDISTLHVIKSAIKMTFKTYPAYIIATYSTGFLMAMVFTAQTVLNQRLFDNVAASVDGTAYIAVITILAIGLLSLTFNLINAVINFMVNNSYQKVGGKLRYLFHKKATRLNPLMFETTAELDNINKAKEGAGNAFGIFSIFVMLITFYLPYFTMMGFYLFTIKPILIVFIVIIFIPNVFTQIVRAKVFTKLENESAPLRREMDYDKSCIADREYFKETRQWGAFRYFRGVLISSIDLFNKKVWKAELKTGLWELALNTCTLVGYIGILLMLVYYLLIGDISVGAFAAVFASVDMMYGLMQEIVCQHFGDFTRNIGTVANFVKFMEEPEVEEVEQELDLTKGIVLKNVSFKYPYTEKYALNNINLNIKNGETIAIVGENGAGKSTLFKLLIGLYMPTDGEVSIGGVETCDENSRSIHNHISSVFQNFQRYKMTFRENIAISDIANVDDDKIKELSCQTNIFDEDEDIDSKLDTMLSREFDGIDLSGGQWQRTAIARGLYRPHDIITLDEPTAAIDPIEETRLYQRFAEISKGKTSVIVTHRLGAAKIADRIILVADGEIKEEGTHDSLIAKNGLYAKMYDSQSGWYSE